VKKKTLLSLAMDPISAGALLAYPRRTGPSCIVLEVGVFDLTGLDALRRIAAERTDTPIIVVAKESDIPMTVLAMKAGAVEFLLKPLTDEELLDAIDHAITRSRAILSRKAEVRELRSRYESRASSPPRTPRLSLRCG